MLGLPEMRVSRAITKLALAYSLLTCGCSSRDELHVTAYRTVSGAEASPWPAGCLATVENKHQRIVGLWGLPCNRVQIGDRAVFNHQGDNVFWVNSEPYNVRSAEAK
jgi:hypothetical protein